jgi:hydroxymethylpyrimidine pyrophosphatase-like HAD family hydrolase
MGRSSTAASKSAKVRIRVLATDSDGTLTTRKILAHRTAAALDLWKSTGRKLILSTGETVDALKRFPDLARFDLVVAENGALLHWPSTSRSKRLAPPPSSRFVRELHRLEIPGLTIGSSIVSVKRPHDVAVREVIERLRLDWALIYNRKDAMALPVGIDKASGLRCAVEELGLTCDQVVSIGDAENDIPLICCCGLGVAVSTAVPALKRKADLVLDHGSGTAIVALIDRLLSEERG